MADNSSVESTIEWLQSGEGNSRIVHHEHIGGQPSKTVDIPLSSPVERALSEQGIESLYQHQADAIEAIMSGSNAVIATPTASGKSLAYTIPALERAVQTQGKTLYIAPYRAIIADQADSIGAFADSLGVGGNATVGVQTGETEQSARETLKQSQPDIVLTTIDQLHLSFLPYAHSRRNWRWLFEQLETIVLDEVHTYRGHFGSHSALVFRRLNRLVEHYNTDPEYICCSATIGNPVEHASAVIGRPETSFNLIDDDASASGDRHWLFWNPPLETTSDDEGDQQGDPQPAKQVGGSTTASSTRAAVKELLTGESEAQPTQQTDVNSTVQTTETEQEEATCRSHHAESVQLFCDLVSRGFQTLVFTQARQGAEQYSTWADSELQQRGEQELATSVYAYHAALSGSRRRDIEAALRRGDAAGVWTTEALELGIDIGTLDAVILDGHPGTQMSMFQQAGRAGRGTDDCLIIVVGADNPLDQYLLQDPAQLFDDSIESATVNPSNDQIVPDHLVCAAGDSYLSPEDDQQFEVDLPEYVRKLEDAGRLQRANTNSIHWEPVDEDAHWETDIRDIGTRDIQLIDHLRDETLGTLEYQSAIRDVHPGAIYVHQKQSYRVAALDLQDDTASLESLDTSKYTQALREKAVDLLDVQAREEATLGGTAVAKSIGTVRVSDRVEKYLEYSHPSDDSPTECDINKQLPPAEIKTTGFVLQIPHAIELSLRSAVPVETYLSGLHAIEHAFISLLPTAVLCDRRDIGGLSTVTHPQTSTGSIFIHDGYSGGAGYAAQAYQQAGELLERTYDLLESCSCQTGCPSCVHSPHCGSANRDLDKEMALATLKAIYSE